ncbi:cytochrome c3 family protein [Geoalkalibacter sp.]|uniref:cytochrome c3 family protein n=1 Tax=Geoalkalibacter sp. TaxID=3041440 RepID=UPI00272E7863|nr:cytochrome c3 family protein [Geoalkalibacter sp.]
MKRVLILATAMAMFAAPAAASIVNTKHDLSSGSLATVKSDNVDELCVFCHTPHAASTTVVNAPLWNRGVSAALVAGDLYDSPSLTAASQPATVVAAVNASDARLCLSCHDGSSMAGGLVNPSNPEATGQPTFSGSAVVTGHTNLFDGTTKLTNDHPIGMDYATAQAADSGLKATPGLRFFSGVMWCASCHNVHDNTHSPFLAADNTGSALCLRCHDK